MNDERQPEYEPPRIFEYGDWAELTQHDPLASPAHPAFEQQLGSSITPHH